MDAEGLNVRRLTHRRQLQRRLHVEPLEAVQRDRLHRPPRGRRLRHRRPRPGHPAGPADHPGTGLVRVPVLGPQRPPPRLLVQARRPLGDHDLRPGGPQPLDARHRPRQQRAAGLGPVHALRRVLMSIVRLQARFAVAVALAVLCLALPACGKKRPPALAGAQPGSGAETTTNLPAEQAPSQPVESGPDVKAVEGGAASGSDLAGDYAATGSSEGGPLADVRFALRLGGAHRRGPRDPREARALAAGPARRAGHDRGPLRRARHRRVQPGSRRAAGPRGARLPGEPRRRRRPPARRVSRQGAPARPGLDRGGVRQEPSRALRADALSGAQRRPPSVRPSGRVALGYDPIRLPAGLGPSWRKP